MAQVRTGLQRGFDRVAVAPGLATWRGEDLTRELKKALDLMDPAKPLFLFVNAFDAHDPFMPIPDGVEWASPQPRITYDVHNERRDKAYFPFVRGKLGPPDPGNFGRRFPHQVSGGQLQRVHHVLNECLIDR